MKKCHFESGFDEDLNNVHTYHVILGLMKFSCIHSHHNRQSSFFYPIYLELTTSFVTGAIYVFACSTWWVNHEWKGVMFETSENHVKDVYCQQAESGELSQFQPISSGKMTLTHL